VPAKYRLAARTGVRVQRRRSRGRGESTATPDWVGRVLALQATAGNRAVTGLLRGDASANVVLPGPPSAPTVQRVRAPADMNVAEQRKKAALALHKKDREALNAMVEEGSQQKDDRRLVNSCEWLKSGRSKLYALTPTGDSLIRVHMQGGDPKTHVALFPNGRGGSAGEMWGAVSEYNHADLDDNANVNIQQKITDGWSNEGAIAVVLPTKRSKERVWETLRHEVQHAADSSVERKAAAGGKGSARYNLEIYKTEYRAFSYQGGKFDKFSNAKTEEHLGYTWTEKQWQIFNDIFNEYQAVFDGWSDNEDIGGGQTFQEAVVAYKNPDAEGVNKFNSVRVDMFYKDLLAIPTLQTQVTDAARAFIAKVGSLKPEDAHYILMESPGMKAEIAKKFAGKAQEQLEDALIDRSLG